MINFMVTKFNTGGAKELFFTSSTSVYSGKIAEAKETDTTEPETEIGRLLRKAEELLVSSSVKPIHILRLAGLIGKNRHPGKFLAGKKDLLNPTGIVNLVQGTDVAEIIWQLKDANLENTIVNVCSPEHPTRAEYYTKQAENLGLLPPTFLYENSVAGKRISGEKLAAKLPNFSFSSILN
jgi:nucleoside-diphosphate-sugar epimerase